MLLDENDCLGEASPTLSGLNFEAGSPNTGPFCPDGVDTRKIVGVPVSFVSCNAVQRPALLVSTRCIASGDPQIYQSTPSTLTFLQPRTPCRDDRQMFRSLLRLVVRAIGKWEELLNMRYASRAAAAVGVLAASSGSTVGEAFLAGSFRTAVNCRSNDDKLTFVSTAAGRATAVPTSPPATTTIRRCRRSRAILRCTAGRQHASLLRSVPPPTTPAVAAISPRSSFGRRRRRTTAGLMSAAGNDGDSGVLGPLSPTEDDAEVFNPNPLARNDPERARVRSCSC